MDLAKSRGAHRVIPLEVSGAFHTPLMKSAVEGMAGILPRFSFGPPRVKIVANVTAKEITTTEEVKEELLSQLCSGIQWQRSVEYMINQGVANFIEIGPGSVLTGLIRRINKDVKTINVGDAATVRSFSRLVYN